MSAQGQAFPGGGPTLVHRRDRRPVQLLGREHVLAWKLAQSPKVTEVLCAPGNAGTAIDARNVDVAADDIERLIKRMLIDLG